MSVEHGDQKQRPNLHVIESFLPSEPPETLPQVTPKQIEEFSIQLLTTYIYPELKQSIEDMAATFLSHFTSLKTHHANPEKIPNEDTLIVGAITLQSLTETAQTELKLIRAYRSDCKKSGKIEEMMEADRELLNWLRIRKVLRIARTLDPEAITLTAQNPTTA